MSYLSFKYIENTIFNILGQLVFFGIEYSSMPQKYLILGIVPYLFGGVSLCCAVISLCEASNLCRSLRQSRLFLDYL